MSRSFSELLKRRLPLWMYRAMPYRWCRWIFREELARGAEEVKRRGWG